MVNDIDLYCFVTEDLNFSDYKKFLKDGSDLSVENLKDFKFYNNFIDEHSQIARYYREKVKEIQNAIKINKCLFYVKDEDTFFFNGKKADINGKVILLRCTIQDTYLVLNKIKQNGGISLSSIEDCEKIFDWIKYYKTDRRIYKMTFKQFKDNHEKLLKFFNGNMFFKTRVKKHSGKVEFACFAETSLFFDRNENKNKHQEKKEMFLLKINNQFVGNIKDDEIVWVAPYLNVNYDNYGKREWRAIIVNNKLQSIARYPTEKNIPVEENVARFTQNVATKLKLDGKFPHTYVVDVFEYQKENGENKFDVVEFNNIIASGFDYNHNIFGNYYKFSENKMDNQKPIKTDENCQTF